MKKLLIIFSCSILSFNVYSQDWKAKLQEESVSIENGKFTTEEYQLLKFQNGASLQIKMAASAPQTSMSRDFFVSVSTSLSLFTLFGILSEAGASLDDVEFEDLDEAIGTPDIALNFIMTATGLQVAVTTEEGTERETMTWDEFFKDN